MPSTDDGGGDVNDEDRKHLLALAGDVGLCPAHVPMTSHFKIPRVTGMAVRERRGTGSPWLLRQRGPHPGGDGRVCRRVSLDLLSREPGTPPSLALVA